MGVVLKTTPVIISVSRHQGTWTANSHVSPYSLLPSRRKRDKLEGTERQKDFCVCLNLSCCIHIFM